MALPKLRTTREEKKHNTRGKNFACRLLID